MADKVISPVHPGEILLEEFMKPLGIGRAALARDLKVPVRRINEIVRGRRGITIDSALRFAKYFGTSPEFWMNLQTHYELELADDAKLVERIDAEIAAVKRSSPPMENAIPADGG